ncbi:MAG: AgmX/PglI C-terminal domain-containing protein [Deltaproteobacteria bacterium]|nr:AgmX/PglI C-terminal domain-containing protein [Deltaproteobacteria bacterium]
MKTSLLQEELAPLRAQIEETRGALVCHEGELRIIEAELETYLVEKERFNALQSVCAALDRLGELGANNLFWDGLPNQSEQGEHIRQLRSRIATFEAQTKGVEETREAVKAKINQCLEDLYDLEEEVRQAYAREERRQEEFVVEREFVPAPFLSSIMPWNVQVDNEKQFRKALTVSMFWCVLIGTIIPMITLPILERTAVEIDIPARLATLVKEKPFVPEPVLPPPQQEKTREPEPTKKEVSEQTAKTNQKPKSIETAQKPAGGGKQGARQKVETTGVLAFKSTFSDLMDEVPVAKLGTDARLTKDSSQIPGQARAQRNLVAMQAKSGNSGGISSHGISTNRGNGGAGGGSGFGNSGQIGGVGVSQVESSVAGIGGEAGRPVSGGPGPGRTDEEIQIVFDRYKAALYRIYNKELRKDPTLRGKLLLRIIIEPAGDVSFCQVESTDLGSDQLVNMIVDRVKRFNFGPKEDVPQVTILYPIDFLPAT